MRFNRRVLLFLCLAFIYIIAGCNSRLQESTEARNAQIDNKEGNKPASSEANIIQQQDDTNLRVLNGKKAIDLSISKEDAVNARVTADIGAKSGKKVNPGLFGVNMLFFTETDQIRANNTYLTSMKYLNPSIMRFPGGTAGDNYLWKKKDIYSSDWYPNKTSAEDMDTDEFLDFSSRYGAERMMVINYRSYIKMDDMDAFYKDAEDWVKYVNMEKKAGVKYWELGNELYFKENSEIRCQFTPEKLGSDYVELRKRLKAIDPNLQLGLTLHKEWNGRQSNVVDNWNERLMKAVKCDVDFIIVHIYSTPSELSFELKGADFRDNINGLRKGIAGLGGRADIPILMTEWNYGNESKVIEGQKIGHLVGLAQGMLEIIDTNIERATIWPMINSSTRLVQQNDYKLTPAGEMYYLLNKELAGCEILDLKLNKNAQNVEIKAFLSPDGKQLRIIALNRSQSKEEQVSISLKGYLAADKGILSTLISSNVIEGKKVTLGDKNMVLNRQQLNVYDNAAFKLPPVSASILEIQLIK